MCPMGMQRNLSFHILLRGLCRPVMYSCYCYRCEIKLHSPLQHCTLVFVFTSGASRPTATECRQHTMLLCRHSHCCLCCMRQLQVCTHEHRLGIKVSCLCLVAPCRWYEQFRPDSCKSLIALSLRKVRLVTSSTYRWRMLWPQEAACYFTDAKDPILHIVALLTYSREHNAVIFITCSNIGCPLPATSASTPSYSRVTSTRDRFACCHDTCK